MNTPGTLPSNNETLNLWSHLILDYQSCNNETLRDVDAIEESLQAAATAIWATILSSHFHTFEPQWVTWVVVLWESHITIHTWPEHNSASIDIFACGKVDFEKWAELLQKALWAKSIINAQNIARWIANDWKEWLEGVDMRSADWERQYRESGAWGMESAIDVYGCDPDLIRDADAIRWYVLELCDNVIDMKRFWDTQVVHFWEDEEVAWYSMTQLIETSLVSGHFANKTNASYLNVFSCKYYDPRTAAEFSCDYFKWKYYKLNINLRDGQ